MLSMIDDIRNRYPHPISGKQADYPWQADDYCVGGAYCYYTGNQGPDFNFPMARELAKVISEHNPELEWQGALEFASAIIDYNDAERFEEAWQLLAQVLPYIPQPKED
jgi:hypothetical protein